MEFAPGSILKYGQNIHFELNFVVKFQVYNFHYCMKSFDFGDGHDQIFWGGGQPDSDMKVDFAEIGIGKIGKIGISDFFNLKLPILANFDKIGNKIFLEFPIFYSISAPFIGVFVPILAKKVL